jgi:hypothetical protein
MTIATIFNNETGNTRDIINLWCVIKRKQYILVCKFSKLQPNKYVHRLYKIEGNYV